ncbi:MAG: methyltransferase domain-containing protein [Balneolia bacterium]|nr:methyltransferase domain-containing protein [Balneolia bacterium]
MKEFWDERYGNEAFAYGTEPNEFLKSQLTGMEPGRILFPAEGEGRNAVYAAELGWEVSAFDISEQGRLKAEELAEKKHVEISYDVCSVQDSWYDPESFDAVVLIFAHFPAELRRSFHRKLAEYLKPGGVLILEGFTKEHLEYSKNNPTAGGPKNVYMLFAAKEIESDFEGFDFKMLTEQETNLNEGLYHVGNAHVLRAVAIKR